MGFSLSQRGHRQGRIDAKVTDSCRLPGDGAQGAPPRQPRTGPRLTLPILGRPLVASALPAGVRLGRPPAPRAPEQRARTPRGLRGRLGSLPCPAEDPRTKSLPPPRAPTPPCTPAPTRAPHPLGLRRTRWDPAEGMRVGSLRGGSERPAATSAPRTRRPRGPSTRPEHPGVHGPRARPRGDAPASVAGAQAEGNAGPGAGGGRGGASEDRLRLRLRLRSGAPPPPRAPVTSSTRARAPPRGHAQGRGPGGPFNGAARGAQAGGRRG